MLEILNGSRLVVAILFIENLPSVYEIINLSWFWLDILVDLLSFMIVTQEWIGCYSLGVQYHC
jgi:hypothetical protein